MEFAHAARSARTMERLTCARVGRPVVYCTRESCCCCCCGANHSVKLFADGAAASTYRRKPVPRAPFSPAPALEGETMCMVVARVMHALLTLSRDTRAGWYVKCALNESRGCRKRKRGERVVGGVVFNSVGSGRSEGTDIWLE